MEGFCDVEAGGFRFRGTSRAGLATAVAIDSLGILCDAGACDLRMISADVVLLSHDHPDHFVALPQILTQRQLLGHGLMRIFAPTGMIDSLEAFLAAGQLASARASWRYELIGVEPGDWFEVGGGRRAQAFEVEHTVTTLGYIVYDVRRKLLEELHGQSPQDLAARRAQGEPVDREVLVPLIAISGDTVAAGLRAHPDVAKARVLLAECTFIDAAHRERAVETAHTHLDDLVALLESFENEAVVLYHFSLRYRAEEIDEALSERLGAGLRQRVKVLLPGAWTPGSIR